MRLSLAQVKTVKEHQKSTMRHVFSFILKLLFQAASSSLLSSLWLHLLAGIPALSERLFFLGGMEAVYANEQTRENLLHNLDMNKLSL